MRLRGRLSALLALAVVAAPALSRAAEVFPQSRDAQSLRDWLQSATVLEPEQVVAVTKTAVYALVSEPVEHGGVRRVWVRGEALDPAAASDQGALSWQISVDADCESGRVREGATTGHPDRNLIGPGTILRPQDADWRAPSPKTPMQNVWRALCEPGFRSPLVEPARVARAAAPKRTSGRFTLQLASVRTKAEADAVLLEARRRFPALLHAHRSSIVPAEVGGRPHQRVQVEGFPSLDAADAACRALRTSGQDCFVKLPAGGPPLKK